MDESYGALHASAPYIRRKRWTAQESADALRYAWATFSQRYPERTYAAWALKRHSERARMGDDTGIADDTNDTNDAKVVAERAWASLHNTLTGTTAAMSYSLPPLVYTDTTTNTTTNTATDTTGIPQRKIAPSGGAERQPEHRFEQRLRRDLDDPAFAAGFDDFDDTFSGAQESVKTPPLLRFEDFEVPDTLADEDLTRAFIDWQYTRNRHLNETLEHSVQVPVTDDAPIAIAFPSDWHIGNAGTDHARIIEDINAITAHPRLYCALGGDPIDNFIIEKMINASRSQLAQVDVQWRVFRHLVRQLVETNSLLFVGAGNHDAWTQRVAGIDGISVALRGLPVINTGEGGFVDVQVGDEHYGIYRKHKPTRFTSGYNPTHFLKQMLRMGTPWDFDIGVSEHIHTPGIEVGEHRPGTGRLRVFITCGSYKVKDPYAEGIGHYGSTYGVPCVLLWPKRHEMLPVMSIEQATTLLDTY